MLLAHFVSTRVFSCTMEYVCNFYIYDVGSFFFNLLCLAFSGNHEVTLALTQNNEQLHKENQSLQQQITALQHQLHDANQKIAAERATALNHSTNHNALVEKLEDAKVENERLFRTVAKLKDSIQNMSDGSKVYILYFFCVLECIFCRIFSTILFFVCIECFFWTFLSLCRYKRLGIRDSPTDYFAYIYIYISFHCVI